MDFLARLVLMHDFLKLSLLCDVLNDSILNILYNIFFCVGSPSLLPYSFVNNFLFLVSVSTV